MLRLLKKGHVEFFLMTERKFFAGTDLLFVLCLLCAFSYFYFSRAFTGKEGKGYAEISVEGRITARVPLDENGMYSPLPAVQIAVRDGAVGFVHSDCPDKTCVRSGFLSLPGLSAVCLPNRVVVRVAAEREEALDSTVY
jgi:hypothetical protein